MPELVEKTNKSDKVEDEHPKIKNNDASKKSPNLVNEFKCHVCAMVMSTRFNLKIYGKKFMEMKR